MRLRFLLSLLIAIFLAPAMVSAQIAEASLPNLTVLADRALTVPLTRLVNQFSHQHHASVTVTFAPSFEQTIAIQEGEAADLFISAQPQSLEQLRQRGLLDVESLKPLVHSRLVMISNQNSPALQADALPDNLGFIAIASPSATAEGYYGQQVINRMKLKSAPIAEMPDTESIYYQLARNEGAIAAIIFETDAALYEGQGQSISLIPPEMHDEARFTSAVIPGGNMDLARKLQHFLTSEAAQREFIKHQFYPVIQ